MKYRIKKRNTTEKGEKMSPMTFVLIFLIVLLAACVVQWLAADCWDFKKFFFRAHGGITVYVLCAAGLFFYGALFRAWWGAAAGAAALVLPAVFQLLKRCFHRGRKK